MQEQLRKEYLTKRIRPIGRTEDYSSLLEFPSHFEIETINACNARCPMCTIDEWDKEKKMMDDSLFEKIIREIALYSHQVKRVNLYRDGEPLLDKKLADRVRFCKENGLKNIAISTNVSLLSEQKARELLSAGIDLIILSIDSLRKDIYEGIRRGLNFEEVISNAQSLLRIREEMGSKCEVWIRMIRQDSNIDEFDAYKSFWQSEKSYNPKLDRIYYHNVFDWGGQLDGFKAVSVNTERWLPCVALWSLMPIFANGDVPMCNVDFNATHKVGNVSHSSIKEIWSSQSLNDIRQLHLHGEKSSINMCKDCNVWEEVTQRDGTPSISTEYTNLLSATPSTS